ncbi:MAG TPA: hypothetical protein VMV16_03935 [Solirubrobacteraceae bacterium]|nr:hypothetical protein [Solirubrobacteraceae bacterium]
MTAVSRSRTRSLNLSLFRGGRFYVWLTLLALALSALSLLFPSTPSYDPYSWLIWGREIFHGQLHIAGGSSWKPLPVIFTTVFALFGSAQPNLWLVVARAGAVVTALMSVRLTVRITWSLVSQSRVGALRRGESWLGRTVAVAPAVLAGAAVLICTTFTRGYPVNMMLGYSEGVMTAAFLIAVERAWDGHHRQAFALGIIPCLDRPEVWLLWGLYGLWLMRRERGARLLVIGLGILMLALWVVPQELGGGHGGILGLATHAQHNRSRKSAANTSFPFWNELAYTLWPLIVERLEFASLLLTGYTAYLLVRARRRLGSWRGAVEHYPAAVAAALAGMFGFVWWLGIAVETEAGFAGNPRYAVIGVMLVGVSGCAAYGWACVGLATLVARVWGRIRRRSGNGRATVSNRSMTWLAAAATLVLLVVFALVPDRFTNRMPTISSIRYALRYQARLREEFAALIRHAGGTQKVMGCGSMMANNYQVTMLAWDLDVPIYFVQALPRKFSTAQGPNVVFQDATSTGAKPFPSDLQMQTWEQAWKHKNGSQYKVVKTDPVTLYMDCSLYSKT